MLYSNMGVDEYRARYPLSDEVKDSMECAGIKVDEGMIWCLLRLNERLFFEKMYGVYLAQRDELMPYLTDRNVRW